MHANVGKLHYNANTLNRNFIFNFTLSYIINSIIDHLINSIIVHYILYENYLDDHYDVKLLSQPIN